MSFLAGLWPASGVLSITPYLSNMDEAFVDEMRRWRRACTRRVARARHRALEHRAQEAARALRELGACGHAHMQMLHEHLRKLKDMPLFELIVAQSSIDACSKGVAECEGALRTLSSREQFQVCQVHCEIKTALWIENQNEIGVAVCSRADIWQMYLQHWGPRPYSSQRIQEHLTGSPHAAKSLLRRLQQRFGMRFRALKIKDAMDKAEMQEKVCLWGDHVAPMPATQDEKNSHARPEKVKHETSKIGHKTRPQDQKWSSFRAPAKPHSEHGARKSET